MHPQTVYCSGNLMRMWSCRTPRLSRRNSVGTNHHVSPRAKTYTESNIMHTVLQCRTVHEGVRLKCWLHPALTPSLCCIQTLSQSITGGKSFTLSLFAPNNDGGRITEFHTTLHICLQAADMSEGLKPYGCECSASASSSIYPTTTSSF